jgi:hypothetical protein
MYTCNLRPDVGSWPPKKNSLKWLANQHSFSDWLRHPDGPIRQAVESRVCWATYVSFFGNKPNDLDSAVSNLKTIDYILDTTNLNQQFNQLIAKKYNLPSFNTLKNTSKPIAISHEDIKYIKEHRAADFEICKQFGILISG